MPKDFSNAEAVEMMQRCAHEIRALKAEIANLAPRAHAYDALCCVLDLLPKKSIGYGEDMVWALEKRIRELTAPVVGSENANDL